MAFWSSNITFREVYLIFIIILRKWTFYHLVEQNVQGKTYIGCNKCLRVTQKALQLPLLMFFSFSTLHLCFWTDCLKFFMYLSWFHGNACDQYSHKFIEHTRICLCGKCSINLKLRVCEHNMPCDYRKSQWQK